MGDETVSPARLRRAARSVVGWVRARLGSFGWPAPLEEEGECAKAQVRTIQRLIQHRHSDACLGSSGSGIQRGMIGRRRQRRLQAPV